MAIRRGIYVDSSLDAHKSHFSRNRIPRLSPFRRLRQIFELAGATGGLTIFKGHGPLAMDHILLSGRATCRKCRVLAWSSAAAPPSWHHRRRRNNQPLFPSLHRAKVSPWDFRTLPKLSARRLSQTCNRPPRGTISPARIQDVLARPTSHPASPPFLFELCPATQSVVHSRACARLRRAAHRSTSPSLFRSFRFSPPASHNWNLRTPARPSTQDRRSGSLSPRSRHAHLQTGSALQDRPCRRTLLSGCTSSSRCESCCLSPRDSRSRALRPSRSSRCPRQKYVLPCWDKENPRDSRSRMPHDAAPSPAPRCRLHPRAWDDTRAAIHRSERPKPDPAAAAFSCAKCAP